MIELRTDKLTKNFGGVQAVNRVSLVVHRGERYALIGPNGAGKSTFFNLIAGELPVSSGTVIFAGKDITHYPVDACAKLGMGRTFQRNNLFLGMSVLENVRLAVQQHMGITHRWFHPVSHYADLEVRAESYLMQVGLTEEKDRKVNELAYGQQRALEIALALAVEPKILLLDEPTAGMSPSETKEMVHLIQELPRSLTMVIVEHDMDVIFTIADRISVLHHGEVIATGTPEEVRADSTVRKIYLGVA